MIIKISFNIFQKNIKRISKNMYVGEKVYIEYLEINEVYATCWLCDYSALGYLYNFDMRLKLSDIGKRDTMYIKRIENHCVDLSC